MLTSFHVILLLLFVIWIYSRKTAIENFVASTIGGQPEIKFKRCDTLSTPVLEQNVLNNFTKVHDESWNIWYPCGYTNVEKELQDNEHFQSKTGGFVMGIDGADNFAAKDRLWLILLQFYGRKNASQYVPESWLTFDQKDIHLFKQYAQRNPGQLYIMKKNIQRQEGLHIFTDHHAIDSAFRDKYVIVQKILPDPYLVDGRKINLRVYILIVCRDGLKTLYVYNDGFVYYSKAPYVSGATRDEIITTGYIDRSVYEKNPLTIKELVSYITRKHGTGTANNLISNRNMVLTALMKAFSASFCNEKRGKNVIYAQTYGVDMQPNSDLTNMKIIEINKGADLGVKDDKDGNVKQNMVDDVYRILGIVQDNKKTGFDKIWEGTA